MSPDHEEFTLELPATARAAPVVRAMAAAVAMAHDIPLDDITDVRLAVDEACSTLLPLASPDTTLRCRMRVQPVHLDVTVQVTGVLAADLPAPDSVSLQILSSLTSRIETHVEQAESGTVRLTIRLLIVRTVV
jgi:serine/threonine-protein kinase RsbW